MADKTISALTASSTPLAGTEVLPIVQSGATVKVAVNDLTVRNLRANATTGILQVTGPAAASTRVATVPDANFTVARTDAAQTFTGTQTFTNDVVMSAAISGSSVSSSAGTTTASLTYCNIVTMSSLATNTMYQYFVTINATDQPYLAVGYLIHTATTDILIPLFSGGVPFLATSGTVDVQISGGVFQYRQKSGGNQAIAWNVARTFAGR